MEETKKLVPKRRFKEFHNAGEWEQRKLGEISDVTKLAGFEFTEHIVYSDTGSIIALRGLNIKNGKLILDEVKYIDKSNFNKLNRSKLYKGDIMLTYVGTVGEVAKISENNRFYLAPNVARIRLNKDFVPDYISQYMRSENFYNDIILPLIATSSQPALSMENVRKFSVTFPRSLEEQKKIGIFLDDLDNLITLQQRKLEKIKSMKKAYLYEMFPAEGESKPKRRFKGFSDDWEQRKLEDLTLVITKGTTPIDKSWSGPVNYIKTESIDKESGCITNTCNISLYEHEGYLKRSQLKDNDVLFSIVGTLGRVGIVKAMDLPANTNQQIAILRLESMCPYYLMNYLKSPIINKYVTEETTVGAQPSLSLWQINKMNIWIPNRREQEKLGAFFKSLDNLITLHQSKLDKLKNLKKSYLNEMFI